MSDPKISHNCDTSGEKESKTPNYLSNSISSGPSNDIAEGGADEHWLFKDCDLDVARGPSNNITEGGADEDWLFCS